MGARFRHLVALAHLTAKDSRDNLHLGYVTPEDLLQGVTHLADGSPSAGRVDGYSQQVAVTGVSTGGKTVKGSRASTLIPLVSQSLQPCHLVGADLSIVNT